MKRLIPLVIAVAFFGCSESPEDLFVKEKLTAFLNQPTIDFKKEGETIFATSGDYMVSGTLETNGNLRILNVGYEKPSFAIYEEDNGEWKSLFQDEIISGELDMFQDLDGDGINEIIIKTFDSGVTDYGLYIKRDPYYNYADRVTKHEDLSLSDFKSYNQRTQGSYEIKNIDGTPIIRVKEKKEWMDNGNSYMINKNYVYEFSDKRFSKNECLEIVGKDIWVRDVPATGEVVMKLNDGDLCKLRKKDKFEIIRNMPGYWYKIEFEGKEGWVFGSQTSLANEVEASEFSSIEEAISKFAFDTADDPNHDGDHIVCSHTGTFRDGEFALLSFDQPGPMAGSNFSKGGFFNSDDNKWEFHSFLGEYLASFNKGGKSYVLTTEYGTVGAYRPLDKYHLYSADTKNKSFRNVQTVFEMGEEIEQFEMYGITTLVSNDDYETLEITEEIKHSFENARKGVFNYVFKFDSNEGLYKLQSKNP